MIRLIQRRLIIPRGDTGSFSIPTLGAVNEGDIAVLSVFDELTHETVIWKPIYATTPTLTFYFKYGDTIDLEPKKYKWDISIYHSPEYDEEGILIGAADVDTYYSAFKLPVCEIREVASDMCKERWRTRDLLLESNNTNTTINSISAIYPWENLQLSFLAGQLFNIAKTSGYEGTMDDFVKNFGKLLAEKTVEIMPFNDFPSEGASDKMYFDSSEGVLFYWDGAQYLPVSATLIANTTIQGGEA